MDVPKEIREEIKAGIKKHGIRKEDIKSYVRGHMQVYKSRTKGKRNEKTKE